MKSIQHKVAQSGEIFYFMDGELRVATNMKEYESLLHKRHVETTTYFEYQVRDTFYRTLLVNNDDIQRHINMETDMIKRGKLFNRYVDAMIDYKNKLNGGYKK